MAEGPRLRRSAKPTPATPVPVKLNGDSAPSRDGAVVIAAITSCTNTSNPSVMLGAGLLARNAVEKGLEQAVGENEPGSRAAASSPIT